MPGSGEGGGPVQLYNKVRLTSKEHTEVIFLKDLYIQLQRITLHMTYEL